MATLCHLDGNAAATDRAVRFLGEEHDQGALLVVVIDPIVPIVNIEVLIPGPAFGHLSEEAQASVTLKGARSRRAPPRGPDNGHMPGASSLPARGVSPGDPRDAGRCANAVATVGAMASAGSGGQAPRSRSGYRQHSCRVEGRRVAGRGRWLFRRFRTGPQADAHGNVSSPRSPNPACRLPAPGSPVESCGSHTGSLVGSHHDTSYWSAGTLSARHRRTGRSFVSKLRLNHCEVTLDSSRARSGDRSCGAVIRSHARVGSLAGDVAVSAPGRSRQDLVRSFHG